METEFEENGTLQVESMTNEITDPGKKVYSEERNLNRERFLLSFTSISSLLFILLIVYIGSLNSPFLALLYIVLFGLLFYVAVVGLIMAFTGIHQLEIHENGFVPPYCPFLIRNILKGGFISWHEVDSILANRRLRSSKIFPYIIVNLKERSFAIPADEITNVDLFLYTVNSYVKVVREWEIKTGLFPVHYFSLSRDVKLEDNSLLLIYPEREERFEFKDIKKVRNKDAYQLLTSKGKRIKLLGMSRKDIQEIKFAHEKFKKSGGTRSSETGIELMGAPEERKEG